MENKYDNIVMLPTKEASILYIDDNGNLNVSSNPELPDGINSNQHLYILSDEEIKEGDYAYYPDLNEVMKVDKGEVYEKGKQIKVIATTDISLKVSKPQPNSLDLFCKLEETLPQPSPQFIEKYIEEYNKNIKTTDGVHLSHCNQGEYEGSCKYGDENCPAMLDPVQDRIDGLISRKDLLNYQEAIEKIKKDLMDEGFDEDDIYEYLEYNLYRLIHND